MDSDTPTGTALVPAGLQDGDREALRKAVRTLERPNWIERVSGLAGKPVEMLGGLVPEAVNKTVAEASQAALLRALRLALTTLPRTPLRRGGLVSQVLAGGSGALGGAFGLAALPVELPVSTTLILRGIAEVAQAEGEDLSDPEAALACLQVFALGGGRTASTPAEGGYFAVRAALAQGMSEAARFIARHGVSGPGAPVVVRLVADIAARFGVVVSQKVAAQAVPVVGALGGAAVNTAFMKHYQDLARAHFLVRRLEREHGKEAVREAYDALRAQEAPAEPR